MVDTLAERSQLQIATFPLLKLKKDKVPAVLNDPNVSFREVVDIEGYFPEVCPFEGIDQDVYQPEHFQRLLTFSLSSADSLSQYTPRQRWDSAMLRIDQNEPRIISIMSVVTSYGHRLYDYIRSLHDEALYDIITLLRTHQSLIASLELSDGLRITLREASEFTGISDSQLQDYIRNGLLHFRGKRRSRTVNAADLATFIKARAQFVNYENEEIF